MVKEAHKSTLKFKHSACILFGDQILSIAHNYVINSDIYKNTHSIHAEVAALLKLPKTNKKIRGHLKIVIIRLSKNSEKNLDNKNYELRLSKPCENCLNTIHKYNIATICYS